VRAAEDEAVFDALESLGQSGLPIYTGMRVAYPPGSSIQAEDMDVRFGPTSLLPETRQRLLEEAQRQFDADIFRDIAAAEQALGQILPYQPPHVPVTPIREIGFGDTPPVDYIPGRAEVSMGVNAVDMNWEALQRLLRVPGVISDRSTAMLASFAANYGDRGTVNREALRGQPQHVAMLDDDAGFRATATTEVAFHTPSHRIEDLRLPERPNDNGDVFPPLTRESFQALRDEIERHSLRATRPLTQEAIDQRNAASIRAAEDEEVFRRLNDVGPIDGPTPNWVVNPADREARLNAPVQGVTPPRRVTMPLFEIVDNPSVRISDVQTRRFDILDRPFEVGGWVLLRPDFLVFCRIVSIDGDMLTLQRWDDIEWCETGEPAIIHSRDVVRTNKPVKDIWLRLLMDEDLF
jgi:hypothetical protein